MSVVPSVPLHFLIRPQSLPDLEKLRTDGVDEHWNCFTAGPENWGLQTYIHALRAGWNVTVGVSPQHEAINLGHVSLLEAFRSGPRDLLVGIRADYRPSLIADCHLVQNQLQVADQSFWIPHWPQPGLISRSSERTGLQRAAYFGQGYYLEGGEALWQSRLREHGVQFDCPPQDLWRDYSEVDLIVAIRSFDRYPYPRKPPSKLINAWIAGVPALVGSESAYSQIGTPGQDHLVADTFEEAMECIAQLRRDPDRYQHIVQAGQAKAQEFTREKILAAWAAVIDTQLVPRWNQLRSPRLARRCSWAIRHAVSGIRSFGVQLRRRLFGNSPLSR